MKLFGQLVRTLVNVATLPVEVAKDVVTLGRYDEPGTYTGDHLRRLKREAGDP